ncbi:MAG: endolytic transglycosylase MltG [Patescibacteria group bacterium]
MRLISGLGLLLVFILAIAYFFYGLQPSVVEGTGGERNTSREVQAFRIVRGEGFRDIAARLSQGSLIKSIAVFKLYAFLTGNAQKFQPGMYELHAGMSVPELVDTLTRGGKNEFAVTIPEGATVKDVAAILAAAGATEDESLATLTPDLFSSKYPYLAQVSSLEGFLFPDTYRFHPNTDPEDAALVLLDNFNRKAWPLIAEEENWYDTLILASYLEREVPEFGDREIVAGILMKRLARSIPLQVDATLSYAKCEGKIRGCPVLRVTRADLTLPSPYNTYQRLGWTPTPISNPGQAALRAAREPKASPYLYYLSASTTKETHFSRTLEEHNAKRARYL